MRKFVRLIFCVLALFAVLSFPVNGLELQRSYQMNYYYRTSDGTLLEMSQTPVAVSGEFLGSQYRGEFVGTLNFSFPTSLKISGAGGNTENDGVYTVSSVSFQNAYDSVFMPVVSESGENTKAVVTREDSLILCNINCYGSIQSHSYWSNWFADNFLSWVTMYPSLPYGDNVSNNDVGANNIFRLICTLDVTTSEILSKLDLTNAQLDEVNRKLDEGNKTLGQAVNELEKLTDDSALNPAVDGVNDLTNTLDGVKNDLQNKIDQTQENTQVTQNLTGKAINVLLPGIQKAGNYISKSVSDSNDFEMRVNDGFGLWTFVGVSVFLVIGFVLFRKFQGEVR